MRVKRSLSSLTRSMLVLSQRIQQQQITKMEQRRLYLRKIQIVPFPESICAAVMKKCPAPISLFRHHIRVRSVSLRSFAEETRIDLVLTAIVQNQFAKT